MHQGFVCFAAFPLDPAPIEIGGCRRAWYALRITFAIRVHHTEIVFRMLIQIFGRNPVPAGRRLACESDIAFEDLVGVAADLYVGTIAVKGLDPMRHPRAVMMRVVPVVATARSFVWSWSHDTCLIAVDTIGPLSGGSVPLPALGRFRARPCRLPLRHHAPQHHHPRRDRDAFQLFSDLGRLPAEKIPSPDA